MNRLFVLCFAVLAACSDVPQETQPRERPTAPTTAQQASFMRLAGFVVATGWSIIARGIGDVLIVQGAGTPETHVAAAKGSISLDTTNGVEYVKNTGVGTTGWVVLGAAGSEV